eukprot:11259014-Ditylum_brightwellii.AAC.1
MLTLQVVILNRDKIYHHHQGSMQKSSSIPPLIICNNNINYRSRYASNRKEDSDSRSKFSNISLTKLHPKKKKEGDEKQSTSSPALQIMANFTTIVTKIMLLLNL